MTETPETQIAEKRAKRKKRPTKDSTKRQPWTFPKNTLEDAIKVAKAIEEKNAGNPMPARDVAIAVGFRQPQDWRFLELLRSASQYGLVSGTGPTASVNLTKLGQDVVAPSSPSQRSEALLAAFRNVKDFEEVEKFYGGKHIPEDEFFLNTVTREFGIPKDRVETFATIFRDNLGFLRAFSPAAQSSDMTVSSAEASVLPTPAEKVPSSMVLKGTRVREFLDTCFVMMPFGSWFDRYYQEIYVPAIKEAGFEPVRADELFTTGMSSSRYGSRSKRPKCCSQI
jgi:hypothetical protein